MKIFFVSLGCDKNLVDSEMMLGELSEAGHTITDSEDDADCVVINTCGFIGDAKKESIDTIIQFGNLKKEGKLKAIVVTGCLAERYTNEIKTSLPEVDAILGTMAIDEIVKACEDAVNGKRNEIKKPLDGSMVYGLKRLVTTGGHYAYLKIAEGCDKRCTYCAIPFMRGKYRSVPMEVLLKEARDLADFGVKELILVAQETTLYGKDLYGEKSLHKLLSELSKIDEIKGIRILYCYPEEIYPELVSEIKNNKKVLHYLDMPIQSASDNVLKRMGRRTNEKELVERIKDLRREIPDICLRTTLIAGFPGETHKDFKKTLSFVKEMKFDRLGVFTYSREEGTKAAKLPGQVFKFIMKLRRNSIMKAQQEIAYKKAESEVGKVFTCLVEGKLPEDNVYVGRTYKDAPNVDGFIFFDSARDLMSGDIVDVKVTGADKYDLLGVINDEFTE